MQVGKIDSYNLEKNFSSFYYEMPNHEPSYITRVIHNEEQIIRCQLRDGTASPLGIVKYWNMDGTEAAQFTIGSGGTSYTNILDVGWLSDEEKICYIMMYDGGPELGSSGYTVVKSLPDGSSPEVMIHDISTTNTDDWAVSSVSGYVGITNSDDYLFLKVGPELHKVTRSAITAGTTAWSSLDSGGYIVSETDCFHAGDGTGCLNLSYQDSDSEYVLYSWYNSNINTLYLRSVSVSGSLTYQPSRWAMLNIPEYSDMKYPLFLNGLDNDALHLLTVSTGIITPSGLTGTPAYLEVFNVDNNLAAFLNVNSSDTIMPAGVGATSTITAKVSNCWGTTLSGKLVQFWVSSGDGGVNPSYDYTDSNGKATTTFTTGANEGISNIAVVVNEV